MSWLSIDIWTRVDSYPLCEITILAALWSGTLRALERPEDLNMTKPQKALLAEIAAGADVNLIAQLARLQGNKREERRIAQTILALLKQRMLQFAKSGGLEISDLGRETAAKQAAKEVQQVSKGGAR